MALQLVYMIVRLLLTCDYLGITVGTHGISGNSNHMTKHVIKFDYEDGERLRNPKLWCGRKSNNYEWYFENAQHVALYAGGSVPPCKNCIKAIIKQLEIEI